MSTFALSRHHPSRHIADPPTVLVLGILVWRRLRRRMRVRRDQQLLQAMPDYLLADIGLSRDEIHSAVSGGRPQDHGRSL